MSISILGLTGPSGAGKGTVCGIFAEYNIPSIDTDAVYHGLLDTDEALTAELIGAFGANILAENGKIDRKRLGARVFGQENTPQLLHTLNTITHKYVMTRTRELVRELENNGATAVLIDAPQLFEAGIQHECLFVIGVLADREQRISRIMQRDDISRDAAERRINAQRDDAFFRSACQYILENNGDVDALRAQVCHLLKISGLEAHCKSKKGS